MVGLKVENFTRTTTPERELLVAMLQRAVLDYLGSGAAARSEAADWLFEDDDTAFSFCWVCSHLGLEKNAVRVQVERLCGGTRRESAPLRVLRRSA